MEEVPTIAQERGEGISKADWFDCNTAREICRDPTPCRSTSHGAKLDAFKPAILRLTGGEP